MQQIPTTTTGKSSHPRRVGYVAIALAACLFATGCTTSLSRYAYDRPVMGTQFRITLYAPSESKAKQAADAAFARIEQLNAVMSDYDRTSELSRLSATSAGQEGGQPVKVSDELWDVLERSLDMSRRSDGAFDVTVGPIVHLWRRARRLRELPAQRRLDEALASVGYQYVSIDPAARTVHLLAPNMSLDLGGIAKGYAAQAALDVLRSKGITSAIVDGGGDMVMSDPPPDAPPDAKGWRIGVAPLGPGAEASRYLLLHNVAIATSGDAWQYVEIDGVRYSHLVNPRTGLGLTDHSGVTVIATDGATADALASAVSVLGPARGIELIESSPGAAALIVRQPHDKVEVYESKRWADFATQSDAR